MAHRTIPAVVDPDATLDLEKRYWKLGLFNPDGSPFSAGGVGPTGPEGPEGPQGEVGPQGPQGVPGEAGYIDKAQLESDFDVPGSEGDITGVSLTIPPIAVPVILRFKALVQKRNIVLGSPTTGAIFLYLTDSSNNKIDSAGATLAASEFATLPLDAVIPASGVSRTYKIRGVVTGTGGRVNASSAGPALFYATKG